MFIHSAHSGYSLTAEVTGRSIRRESRESRFAFGDSDVSESRTATDGPVTDTVKVATRFPFRLTSKAELLHTTQDGDNRQESRLKTQ